MNKLGKTYSFLSSGNQFVFYVLPKQMLFKNEHVNHMCIFKGVEVTY